MLVTHYLLLLRLRRGYGINIKPKQLATLTAEDCLKICLQVARKSRIKEKDVVTKLLNLYDVGVLNYYEIITLLKQFKHTKILIRTLDLLVSFACWDRCRDEKNCNTQEAGAK